MRRLPHWTGPTLCFLLFAAGALWLRWPTFGFSLWNLDEAIHAAAARTLLDGGVLYRDAIDQRTPLSYYAVAGIFALFGENNLWAVRCFIALLIAATGVMLFLAGRALHRRIAGALAGALYVLLASALLYQGDANAANTEWFVAFFSSAGAAIFLAGQGMPGMRRLFFTGLMFSCAFLSKQPALLDAAAPFAVLLFIGWQRRRPVRDVAAQVAALAGGWFLPGLLTAGWLAANGALRDAVFYTWSYNLTYYGPETATNDRFLAAGLPFRLLATLQPWLLAIWTAGAAVGLHRLLQRQPTPKEHATNPGLLFVIIWTLTGLAGSAAGGRDFQHYAIQFLAPFCLGAGLALVRFTAWAWSGSSHRWLRPMSILLPLLITYDALTGAAAARHRTVPEDASLRISNYIRENSAADDRIFVWGYHPDIYLLSERRPASRFLYASFLTGLVPWTNGAADIDTSYAIVPGAMETLLHDLQRSQPRFIVDCSPGPNRFWQKYPLEKFPALHAFIRTHYRQAESHYFLPQGFRLLQRRSPGEGEVTEDPSELPADTVRSFTLGTLASPLAPLRATAVHGAATTMVGHQLEYFLHAPSALTYRLPGDVAIVRGGFGLRPGAYAADNSGPTDGAEFIVRWRPDHGPEQVLFRRLLRPREEAADRGVQPFRVVLPPHHGGELDLVIDPGPQDNTASDWTYWADLMLEKSS
ncbi:MAG TPA: glycosyltransferase family 39 protein [Opitutaceae bacterium]|nr:glycosyltransferase family 39 protein [Opitutaceae bacterium]